MALTRNKKKTDTDTAEPAPNKELTRLDLAHRALNKQIKDSRQMITYNQDQLAKITPLNNMWSYFSDRLAEHQVELGAATITKQQLDEVFGLRDLNPWIDLILGPEAKKE